MIYHEDFILWKENKVTKQFFLHLLDKKNYWLELLMSESGTEATHNIANIGGKAEELDSLINIDFHELNSKRE